jgi:tyrosinase
VERALPKLPVFNLKHKEDFVTVELQINNTPNADSRFLTWAPSPCRVRVTDPSGATPPAVTLKISSKSLASGGVVLFRAGNSGAFSANLTVSVPTNGSSLSFFAAGKFGSPSSANGDVTIEARSGSTVVGSVPVMVRIRKNANTLSSGERDRFIAALAKLNNQGQGRYQDFRDMHTQPALSQAHGAPGFLPWHRSYILDLERDLQAIDPSVALPYWRFDQAAPNIFTTDFLGKSDSIGTVQFNPSNPLRFWKTDGQPGVNRRPLFPVSSAPPGLLNEAQTLALGTSFDDFRDMEGNPHGFAHTSFGGWIQSPATAPKDPLFFLLHTNVDRLWAKWQKKNGRFDPNVAASFVPNGNPLGHNLNDTMWPWNGIKTPPRPPFAPGGQMANSPCVSAPGPQPRVSDCLDYRGAVSAAAVMGFDYDDVQFP